MPQRLRGHGIAAHGRDVRVAPVTGQDRQHQRAQHVALGRRVAASVHQRASFHPLIEHAAGAQEFGEEHQLTVRRGLRRLVPAHVHAPPARAHHHRVHGLRHLRAHLDLGFTHRVSVPHVSQPAPVLALQAIRCDLLPFLG